MTSCNILARFNKPIACSTLSLPTAWTIRINAAVPFFLASASRPATYLVAKRHEHFDELHRVRNLAKRLAVDVARLSARGDDDVVVRFVRGGRLGLGFGVGIVGRDADEPRERYLVVALPLRVRVRVAVPSRPCPGVVKLRGGGVRDRVRLQDLIHHTFELVVDRDAPGAGGVPRVNVGIDGSDSGPPAGRRRAARRAGARSPPFPSRGRRGLASPGRTRRWRA